MTLSSKERSRRIIDIIAHQSSMFCDRKKRGGVIASAMRAHRLFWAKEAGRIKRPEGAIGELLLLEACVYRCVSAIKEHISKWEE